MRLRVFLIISMWVVSPVIVSGQSVQISDRLATPQQTMQNFLYWQNPPNVNISTASEALTIDPSISKEKRYVLARQLKAVLDGRGLLVHLSEIPNDSDFIEEVTGESRFRLFPIRTPEIYLVKVGEKWLFSRQTLIATPRLYSETFSVAAQLLIDALPPVFQFNFLGMALWQYTGIFFVLLVAFFVRKVSEFSLRKLAGWLVKYTPPHLDEEVVLKSIKPLSFLIFTLTIRFFYADLQLPVHVNATVNFALDVMIAASILWLSFQVADLLCDRLTRITAQTETKFDDQLIPMFRKMLKIFAITIGVLILMQSFGYSISSLLAGLGIGGVAVALAAQDTLANFFGSITIFADKPFQIGDWIVTGKVEGTVEEVGFRSTRIRTFYDSVISVPNSKLANSDVDNMGLRRFRRIRQVLGVTYSTTPEQMQAFVEGVRAIITANPSMRKDYYEVHFNGYGDFSLNVLVYCFVKVSNWSEELRVKHNFFLEILRLADQLNIEFAFPTQTVHLDGYVGEESGKEDRKVSNEELAKSVVDFGPDGRLSRPGGPRLTVDGKLLDYGPDASTTRGSE